MTRFHVSLLLLFTVFSFTNPVQANEIYVPGDYATIQEAVNNTSEGDTIHVAQGTYFENVEIIGKSISLLGEDKDNTVIDAGGNGSAVMITYSYQVILSGFTLKNASDLWPHSGAVLDYTDKTTISDNCFTDNERGILLARSNDSTINNNNLREIGSDGIHLRMSNNSTISNNLLSNIDVKGIYLKKSSGNRIKENVFEKVVSVGVHMVIFSNENTIVGNSFYGSSRGVLLDASANMNSIIENNFDHPYGQYCAVYLDYKISDCLISDNTITNSNLGIKLREYSANCTIINNRIHSCSHDGIGVGGTGHRVSGNIIISCSDGIDCLQVTDTVIEDNTILSGIFAGIDLHSSNSVEVINNRIAHSIFGINIQSVFNSKMLGNIVSLTRFGTSINGKSSLNRITENTFLENELIGIHVEDTATDNEIYYNAFSANQVDARDDVGGNSWSNITPPGGNFWSSYTGEDRNGDGLGDSPVAIDGSGGSSDAFPFMAPYGGGLLWVNEYTVSTKQINPTVELYLEAAEENASRYFLILGSLSGTKPGIPLPGGQVELPLVWDSFTNLLVKRLNTPMFDNFLGQLDRNGKGSARFIVRDIPVKYVGKTIHFAYCLADPGPFDYVSGAIPVHIVDL